MPPVVKKIKDVVERVRNLFLDIKNDVTEFYEVTTHALIIFHGTSGKCPACLRSLSGKLCKA